MKKILKLALIPAAFLIATITTGCNKVTAEVALITDVGDIDDGSFNQSSWEAIKEYCNNKGHTLSYDYYRPFADSDFARRLAIQQAVAKGAKIIICPGFKFVTTISNAQLDYPTVKFLLLDATVSNYRMNNTVCVGYDSQISGFMAGYAVAQDYLKYDYDHDGIKDEYKFGYCGGTPYATVYSFGYGFIQGCVIGTSDFIGSANVNAPKLSFNYNYAGVFAQDDAAAARIKDWYADGTKAVFSCGGKLYQSITEGVKDYNVKNGYNRAEEGKLDRNAARWIGVDTDQYKGLSDADDKKTIITSALKGLNPTILTALENYQKEWTNIGDLTPRDIAKHFDTRKEAEDYINDTTPNTGTAALFSGFDTKVEPAGDGDNKYKIMMAIKGTNNYFEFKNQVNSKTWTLGVDSKFGKEGVSKDYVGLPDEDISEEKTLRGFFNFTKAQYNELKDKFRTGSVKYPVYTNGGSELLHDASMPDVKDGYPTFMSHSNKYFVDVEKTETFNQHYFNDYPAAQIVVNVI